MLLQALQLEPVYMENESESRRFVTDQNLHRYLRARNFDQAKAKKLILETLTWRLAYKPEAITAAEVEPECATGKIRVLAERDVHHRPIIVMDSSRENSKTHDSQLRHLVWQLERAKRKMNTQPVAAGEKPPPPVEKVSSTSGERADAREWPERDAQPRCLVSRCVVLFVFFSVQYCIFINMERNSIWNSPPMKTSMETLKTLTDRCPEHLVRRLQQRQWQHSWRAKACWHSTSRSARNPHSLSNVSPFVLFVFRATPLSTSPACCSLACGRAASPSWTRRRCRRLCSSAATCRPAAPTTGSWRRSSGRAGESGATSRKTNTTTRHSGPPCSRMRKSPTNERRRRRRRPLWLHLHLLLLLLLLLRLLSLRMVRSSLRCLLFRSLRLPPPPTLPLSLLRLPTSLLRMRPPLLLAPPRTLLWLRPPPPRALLRPVEPVEIMIS